MMKITKKRGMKMELYCCKLLYWKQGGSCRKTENIAM